MPEGSTANDGGGAEKPAESGPPGPQGLPGAAGLDCWDLNGNGVGDAGEDINADGVFDAADCQGAVPDGAFILSDSSTPPAGFTFTGLSFDTGGIWSTAVALPVERAGHSMAVADGAAFVMGGVDQDNRPRPEVLRYDSQTDFWSFREPMPTARAVAAAAESGGKIYVISGIAFDDENGQFLADTVEAYDPVSNTWSRKAPIPTARQFAMAAAVDGKIYVIGGAAESQADVLTSVEVYDTASDSWSVAQDIPTPRLGAAIGALDGRIVVAGGAQLAGPGGETVVLDVVEEFDPLSNSWTTRTPLPHAVLAPASTVADERLFVIGGLSDLDATPTNVVVEYEPEIDEWRTRAAMSLPRVFAAAATVAGKIIVTAGTTDGATIGVSHEQLSVPITLYVHAKN